jgi:hypothetical protein
MLRSRLHPTGRFKASPENQSARRLGEVFETDYAFSLHLPEL